MLRFSETTVQKIVFGLPLICFLLTMVQDRLHSWVNDYNFYITESALFAVWWLLFLPSIYLLSRFAKTWRRFPHWTIPPCLIVLSGLHLLVFSVSVVAISTLPLYEHPYSFSKVLGYGLANQLWVLFLAYMGLYFYITKKVKRNLRNRNRKSRIMVSVASKRIFIDCNAIQYIQTERPYLAIHTAEKTYLHADTLTNMKERLKLEDFIQIHRSCLVNEDYIKAMVSRGNGDYDLELHSGKVLRLSRTYTHHFKNVLPFTST